MYYFSDVVDLTLAKAINCARRYSVLTPLPRPLYRHETVKNRASKFVAMQTPESERIEHVFQGIVVYRVLYITPESLAPRLPNNGSRI